MFDGEKLMINLYEILNAKYPEAFKLPLKIYLQDDGDGPYIKEWLLEEKKPSNKEINEWSEQLSDDIFNNQQRELRKSAYMSIGEQLDMQYWDKENGTNNWAEHIAAVKQQYPLRNVD